MNTYILLSILCVLSIYGCDEPLDTSSVLELSREQGVVSIFYTKSNGARSGTLTIKLHEKGVAYLCDKSIPMRVSVLLNRNEKAVSLMHYDPVREKDVLYDEYCVVPLSNNINLAIMKEAIDFSIDKDLHTMIKSLPKRAALYLSYSLSQEEAQALRIIEKNLEEKDAQRRSPIVILHRLLSQEYKGPL